MIPKLKEFGSEGLSGELASELGLLTNLSECARALWQDETCIPRLVSDSFSSALCSFHVLCRMVGFGRELNQRGGP